MPRNLLSLLRGKSDMGSTTMLLDLEIESDALRTSTDDISSLELSDTEFISPSLKIQEKYHPQIPVIGIGGAGLRIADSISKRLKLYNIEYKVMGIDVNKEELDKQKNISDKFQIQGSAKGTGKQYLKALHLAKSNSSIIRDKIKQYLDGLNLKLNNEIVFVLHGAGGVGVGVSLEVIDILLQMGKRPVPFLLLPSSDENTRIKFNAAVALYNYSYAPSDRCRNLVTICLDNELFMLHNSGKDISSTIMAINERLGAAIGDLIISTELPSDGYSSDLNEFIEIFRQIKGVGCLNYYHSENGNELDQLFKEGDSRAKSIVCDIHSGTRAYFFVQAAKKQLTTREYRSLLNNFNNIDIFPKLNEVGNDKFVEIRGIATGIKIPERISSLMSYAEDVRVTLLETELANAKSGKGNPKIDKLEGDKEIEVKDAEELKEIRAEEYAQKRRGGDLS